MTSPAGFLARVLSITWGAELEKRALSNPRLFAIVLAALLAAAGIVYWRTSTEANSQEAALRFDEVADSAIHALDLH